MAEDSLRALARHLDVAERTLRRAASEGLLHGRRVSERRYETTLREEAYLREHWPVLRALRAALRTEPNVRLAVLFGSVAVGRESDRSDLDLLVVVRHRDAGSIAALAQRLRDRLGRDVQLVRLEDAQRSPGLMVDVFEQGRVLIDRDHAWAWLKATERGWRRRAAAQERASEDAMPDLERS
jgi:predicted nucleotidyltransferase